MADLQQARAAKSELRAHLGRHHGIRGIGVERLADGWAVRVNVETAADDDLPSAVDGVPVRVRVVGSITARR